MNIVYEFGALEQFFLHSKSFPPKRWRRPKLKLVFFFFFQFMQKQ